MTPQPLGNVMTGLCLYLRGYFMPYKWFYWYNKLLTIDANKQRHTHFPLVLLLVSTRVSSNYCRRGGGEGNASVSHRYLQTIFQCKQFKHQKEMRSSANVFNLLEWHLLDCKRSILTLFAHIDYLFHWLIAYWTNSLITRFRNRYTPIS